MSQQSQIYTWEEVGKHIIPSDCWVVVGGEVYNVTDFLVEHPGGDEILIKYGLPSCVDTVVLMLLRNSKVLDILNTL